PPRGVFTIGQLPELGVSSFTHRKPSLFPNPAQHELRIQFPIDYHESWQWRCFDSSGKQVASGWSSRAQASLSVADWTSGLYIIEVRSQRDELFRERVIIQH
ncbi:MAG: T9SS type A sorting domain-containing protein, partial [Flavobacteriales bacterium]